MPPKIKRELANAEKMPFTYGIYMARLAWVIVNFLATPFRLPRLSWFYVMILKSFGATIGRNSAVREGVKITIPWELILGDNSIIGPGVTIYNLGKVTIGDNVVISRDTYLCTATHDFNLPSLPLVKGSIFIENGVWIGTKAFIGPNVHVGQDAVIGACTVVMSNVDNDTVMIGNPARTLDKKRDGKKLEAKINAQST